MKTKIVILFALIALMITTAVAQPGNQKINGKMIYHNGPVLTGSRNLYFLFYGCWAANCGNLGDQATMEVLTNFAISAGGSPYMQINSTYPDANGQAPSGQFIFGGSVLDSSYSHGVELTHSDVVAMISEKVNNFELPQDSNGIYIIFTSADISANEMGFCTPGAPPFHSTGIVNGVPVIYAFIGNARRCPTVAGASYFGPGGTGLTTPNGTFSGDAMVTNLAHVLNSTVTNPNDTGWYDRYGLENADKCAGMLGTTYLAPNGAQANIRLGGHDYLLEQNWVNDRRGRCALSR